MQSRPWAPFSQCALVNDDTGDRQAVFLGDSLLAFGIGARSWNVGGRLAAAVDDELLARQSTVEQKLAGALRKQSYDHERDPEVGPITGN